MTQTPADQDAPWSYMGRNTFGHFLKRQRTLKAVTRQALAAGTGLSERDIEALEVNQQPPSYATIKKLAARLKIPERQLMEAAGYVRPGADRQASTRHTRTG